MEINLQKNQFVIPLQTKIGPQFLMVVFSNRDHKPKPNDRWNGQICEFEFKDRTVT